MTEEARGVQAEFEIIGTCRICDLCGLWKTGGSECERCEVEAIELPVGVETNEMWTAAPRGVGGER